MEKLKDCIPITRTNIKSARIEYIYHDDFRALQKLMAVGIFPGRKIEIIHRVPSYIIKIGNTIVALGEEVAEKIYVKRQTHT